MADLMTTWVQPVFTTLLGVAVGGLVTRLADKARSKRERLEKRFELEREAIAAALEWIEPMRDAEIAAWGPTTSAIHGEFDHERYLQEFPHLNSRLAELDLTGAQRALLPADVYARGHSIVRMFDELRVLGIRYGQMALADEPFAGLNEISAKSVEIGSAITSLEDDLRLQYRKSFE